LFVLCFLSLVSPPELDFPNPLYYLSPNSKQQAQLTLFPYEVTGQASQYEKQSSAEQKRSKAKQVN
jgi:hypothetical protein